MKTILSKAFWKIISSKPGIFCSTRLSKIFSKPLSRSIFMKAGLSNRVDGEEDLKPRPGINLNPPPKDGKCECCGNHISELKPFGNAGDSLVDDFEGSLLVRRFRRMSPPDEEAGRVYGVFFGNFNTKKDYEKAKAKMIQKLGEKEAKRITSLFKLSDSFESSWECRDCAVLDIYEYHEKKQTRYSQGHGDMGKKPIVLRISFNHFSPYLSPYVLFKCCIGEGG